MHSTFTTTLTNTCAQWLYGLIIFAFTKESGFIVVKSLKQGRWPVSIFNSIGNCTVTLIDILLDRINITSSY